MTSSDALLITGRDIRRVMTNADFLQAAELAFRSAAEGRTNSPPPMHLPMAKGAFHAKGASIALERDYVAVKVNGNFPGNPAAHGLPTIQGAVLLADGRDGRLLAILDSIELTLRRTAAASALAAKLLAPPKPHAMLICGCGDQGRAHVEALREPFPIDRLMLWDRDPLRAERLAAEKGGEAVAELAGAAANAQIIVTCTTAAAPFLTRDMVRPGTFIAAVGADNGDKSEIDPRLMAAAAVVTDVTEQCAAMGDLSHAIAAGCMTRADVRAELGELLIGVKEGRRSPDEILIFDSTGTGLQDVAAAAAIYQRCLGGEAIGSIGLSAF